METNDRKAYREKCKWHGVLGGCHVKSKCETAYFGVQWSADILCTPSCDCPRMRRYDKEHKEE